MPDTPANADSIVDAALDLPQEERAAYLDQACGKDIQLRELVEALLLAHLGAPKPRQAPAAPAPQSTMPVVLPVSEKPGDRIGRYKLLQPVGEGGCGVVYMAEQEEPVRRRVALKVIKLGMDTKQVIARFEAERQALALMDHPNIARVLDAGATETGRPYFVMELVRGIKITDYCDHNNLPTTKRLELFIQVCKAIQHAHQKGIIHRDVKPSNILVTLHDGVPVPKVIDFGIAKATEQRLTDKTLFTALEQFVGTPAYMSPEQAEMSGLDIDTRSDIYSLGVLLYELLTGKMPFEPKELMRAGLEEMRRIIREHDPVKPSTRLSSLDAAEQTTVAKRRQTEPPKLVHLVRGDLDWIVMKCLEKDRTRRYETANGLANDVQRHIDDDPILASPPSATYRFVKLIRRNRMLFGAAAAVLSALVAGLALSTWLYLRERAARQFAKQAATTASVRAAEARQAADVSEAILKFFVEQIVKAARPLGESGGLGKDVKLGEALEAAEPYIATQFSNQPIVEAIIRDTLGEGLQYLGSLTEAIDQHERAVKLFREHRGPAHEQTLGAITKLASAYSAVARNEDAIRKLREVLAAMDASPRSNVTNRLDVLNSLATALLYSRRPAQAATLFEQIITNRNTVLGPGHSDTISSRNGLAIALNQLGRRTDALPILEASYALALTNLGPSDPTTLSTMSTLGNAYHAARRYDKALPLLTLSFQNRSNLYGMTAPVTLTSLNNLAMMQLDMGDYTNAVRNLERVLEIRRAKFDKFEPLHPDTLSSIHNLAGAYRVTGRFSNALPLYHEAIEKRSLATNNFVNTLKSMEGLGLLYRDSHDYSNAVVVLEKVISRNKLPPTNSITLSFMESQASIYRAAGRTNEEIEVLEEIARRKRSLLAGSGVSSVPTNSLDSASPAKLSPPTRPATSPP